MAAHTALIPGQFDTVLVIHGRHGIPKWCRYQDDAPVVALHSSVRDACLSANSETGYCKHKDQQHIRLHIDLRRDSATVMKPSMRR